MMKLAAIILGLSGFISLAQSCPTLIQNEVNSWPHNGDTAHQLQLTFDASGCSPNEYHNFVINVSPDNLQVIQSWNLGTDLGGGQFRLPDWTTTDNFDAGYTYLGDIVPMFSLTSFDGGFVNPNPSTCANSCPQMYISFGPREQPHIGNTTRWDAAFRMDISACQPNDYQNMVVRVGPSCVDVNGTWSMGTDNGDGTYTLSPTASPLFWTGGIYYHDNGCHPTELCVESFTGSLGCPRIVANEITSWPQSGEVAHQLGLSIDATDCPGTYCDFELAIQSTATSVGSWNLGTFNSTSGTYKLPDWARANSWQGGYTYLGETAPNAYILVNYSTDCPY